MSLEVRRLGIWEEAVSVLKYLEVREGLLFAEFDKMVLALPLELEEKMHPNIGKRVTLLHTDVTGKEYLFRVIPDQTLNTDEGA